MKEHKRLLTELVSMYEYLDDRGESGITVAVLTPVRYTNRQIEKARFVVNGREVEVTAVDRGEYKGRTCPECKEPIMDNEEADDHLFDCLGIDPEGMTVEQVNEALEGAGP